MDERKARLGLRLVSLLLAVVLWLVVTLERTENQSVRVVESALTFETPNNLILIDPPRSVTVRLRGRTEDVKNLNPQMVAVLVDLRQITEPGVFGVQLNNDNVLLPGDLEVVALEPSIIDLDLDVVESRNLPVRVELSGEPAAGAELLGFQTQPNQVMATGPRSILSGLTSLSTAAVSLDGHALNFEEVVEMRPPNPLVTAQPSRVRVTLELQPPSLPETEGGERRNRG